MTDNLNLIESIRRKQAELLMNFDELKAEGIDDYDIIESIQRQQAEMADEFNHWLEQQQIEQTKEGEENND